VTLSDLPQTQTATSIVFDSKHITAVTPENNCVTLINRSNKFMTYGQKRTDPIQFSDPYGIAKAFGCYYISDTHNNRIVVLDDKFVFKMRIGGLGGSTRNDRFFAPKGLAVSGDHLYVADYLNNRVQILNAHTLDYVATIGSYGRIEGKFHFPETVAVSTGKLFVVEERGKRVQAFGLTTNKFLFKVGYFDIGPNHLTIPCELAIIDGYCLVAEKFSQRIAMFREDNGAFVTDLIAAQPRLSITFADARLPGLCSVSIAAHGKQLCISTFRRLRIVEIVNIRDWMIVFRRIMYHLQPTCESLGPLGWRIVEHRESIPEPGDRNVRQRLEWSQRFIAGEFS
jgi:hypothetical protein